MRIGLPSTKHFALLPPIFFSEDTFLSGVNTNNADMG